MEESKGTTTTIIIPPAPEPDGKFLHFLKELPAWVIIFMFVGIFLILWRVSHDDFIPRIIDSLIGALLTSVVGQRVRVPVTANPTNIAADTVKADNVESATTEQGDIITSNLSDPNKSNP